MDLKTYYRRIRETEAAIAGETAVVISLETPDGGRAGLLTEVPRAVAARLIAQSAAELATDETAAAFREEMRARKTEEDARRAAARIQVSVISEADARLVGEGQRAERKRKAAGPPRE